MIWQLLDSHLGGSGDVRLRIIGLSVYYCPCLGVSFRFISLKKQSTDIHKVGV